MTNLFTNTEQEKIIDNSDVYVKFIMIQSNRFSQKYAKTKLDKKTQKLEGFNKYKIKLSMT